MSLMQLKVYGPEKLNWPFGNTNNQSPIYTVGIGPWPRHVFVDPFPAYAPDEKLVKKYLDVCNERFPFSDPEVDSQMSIVSHDATDRINGFAASDHFWERKDGTEYTAQIPCPCGCGKTKKEQGLSLNIVLYAKRIPLLPAMVRYLVGHEYGHCAFNYSTWKMGWDSSDRHKMEEKYVRMRGIENPSLDGGGGRWHELAGEIIANDFRIMIAGLETEFWPHPCQRPEDVPFVREWWTEAFKVCGLEPKFAQI